MGPFVCTGVVNRCRVGSLYLLEEVLEIHRDLQRSTESSLGWRYATVERYGSRDRVLHWRGRCA
jgi:hypothetical protein